MSVMGFQKSLYGGGGCVGALSKFFFDFLIFFKVLNLQTPKPLTST